MGVCCVTVNRKKKKNRFVSKSNLRKKKIVENVFICEFKNSLCICTRNVSEESHYKYSIRNSRISNKVKNAKIPFTFKFIRVLKRKIGVRGNELLLINSMHLISIEIYIRLILCVGNLSLNQRRDSFGHKSMYFLRV